MIISLLCIPCKLWNMLQKIRRQFFSFFMPLLHLQLLRVLCFMASIALRHSPCASVPVTALKLFSLPATHCLIVRYLVLQLYSFRHCSLAFTQSGRVGREDELPSPFKVNTESGSYKEGSQKDLCARCELICRLFYTQQANRSVN